MPDSIPGSYTVSFSVCGVDCVALPECFRDSVLLLLLQDGRRLVRGARSRIVPSLCVRRAAF